MVLAWQIWRATNSTGYKFIGLRIHQVRSLEFSPDEFIGLQIHQGRSLEFSPDELVNWELLEHTAPTADPGCSRTIRLWMVSLLNPTRTLKLLAVREKGMHIDIRRPLGVTHLAEFGQPNKSLNFFLAGGLRPPDPHYQSASGLPVFTIGIWVWPHSYSYWH